MNSCALLKGTTHHRESNSSPQDGETNTLTPMQHAVISTYVYINWNSVGYDDECFC